MIGRTLPPFLNNPNKQKAHTWRIQMADNTIYDLKTIKLKPETYSKLIQAKARLEYKKKELHSFDALVDHLVEFYISKDFVPTNDPKLINKFKNFMEPHP